MAKIRVLIVDDSAFMRNMLTRIIQRDARFEVIDTAENGQEAVKKTADLKPDVVTLDIEMPIMNGLDALRRIMDKTPVPVVMISSLTEAGARETIAALEAGAVDVIPKSLQNREKNIFHAGDIIHEKLAAAAQAKMDRVMRPAPVKPMAPVKPKEAPKVLGAKTTSDGTPLPPPPIFGKKLPLAKLLLIGSSTGGPRALQDIIPSLASNLRVPVVIAQHMPPSFTNAMAIRLNEQSLLSVKEAQDGDVLKAGHVYVAPGGQHMRIYKDGMDFVVRIKEDRGESLYKPSVDVLAESALNSVGKDILAVMLTGMGNDGAKWFKELHAQGAYTIAQDEESCVVFGMPKAVIDDRSANEVTHLRDIAGRISSLLE